MNFHTPAPQRHGFREELARQVQAAVRNSSPMSHRSTYLKFGLGLPLVGAALYGLIFAITSLPTSGPSLAKLTATEVQAAVTKSLSETFAELQADTIRYERTRQDNTGGGDTSYTTEVWHAGLNKLYIGTDNQTQQINSAQFTQAVSETASRTCTYTPGGTTYDGPTGSYTTEPYVCGDGTITETVFAVTTGTDIEPTTFITAGNEPWLIVQWDTKEAITSDIEVETLAITTDEQSPYRYGGGTYPLNPVDLAGNPRPRSMPEEFVNQPVADGFRQSIYLPDIEYANKYEPEAKPETIYLQIHVDEVTSAVYRYNVANQSIQIASATEVSSLAQDYQISSLQNQEFNANFDVAKDSADRLAKVQATGKLEHYEVNADNQLVAVYLVAEDSPYDQGTVLSGRYQFVIDQATNQLKSWMHTNPFGATSTTILEANEDLTDSVTSFFTEDQFQALLTERGAAL